MSFLIFSLVVIAISALLIWLVFKIKSTAAKIVLTIVIVIGALITLAVGGLIIGASWAGNQLGQVVEDQSQEDLQKQEQYLPKVKDTGEEKETFGTNETVVGNGVEMQILNTYTIVDNKNSEFLDEETLCAVDFRLKNTEDDMQSIYSSQFELKEPDGTLVSSAFLSDEEFSPKFDSFTVELEPQKEITKSVAYDCVSSQTPLSFEYSGGSFLAFSFFTEESKFKPIRFNVSF